MSHPSDISDFMDEVMAYQRKVILLIYGVIYLLGISVALNDAVKSQVFTPLFWIIPVTLVTGWIVVKKL